MDDLIIVTVSPNSHRPTLVGPIDRSARLAQALEDHRRRVAKAVPTHADDPDGGPQRLYQRLRRAARGAVMTDLQHLDRWKGWEQQRLRRPSGIAGEQGVEPSEAQVQDQGVLVGR